VAVAIIGAGLYALGSHPGDCLCRHLCLWPVRSAEHRHTGHPGRRCSHRSAVPAGSRSVLQEAAAVRQPLRRSGQPLRPLAAAGPHPATQHDHSYGRGSRIRRKTRRSGPGSAPVVHGRRESEVRWPCPPSGG
jgi:hypothetical protein